MIEPRPADGSALNTLIRAKALIEHGDFDSAIVLYATVLDSELAPALRGEVLTNLAAALCMSAREQSGRSALARLEQARRLLVDALPLRSRNHAPEAWATTRANLALVHLARYENTWSRDELLSAHLALDDTEPVLRSINEPALTDWISAIRDQLIELQDRRGRPR